MKLSLSFLFLFLSVACLWAGGPTQGTVTMQMVGLSAQTALEVAADSGGGKTYPIKIGGKTYKITTLDVGGYATLFSKTGGPTLAWLGLNFRKVSNPGSIFFAAYNAFLVLMIGFHWFKVLDNSSKGKGGLDIIPLVLKLCVGIIVCYNIPFVYGTAMVLRDVGQQVVLTIVADDPSQMANNLGDASPATKKYSRFRQKAVADSIRGYLPMMELIPIAPPASGGDTADLQRNSGRARLAWEVAALNSAIRDFQQGAQVVVVGSDGTPQQSNSSREDIRSFVDFVGFSPGIDQITWDGSGTPTTLSRADAVSNTGVLSFISSHYYANKLKTAFIKSLANFVTLAAQTYGTMDEIRNADKYQTNDSHTYFLLNSSQRGNGSLNSITRRLMPIDQQVSSSVDTGQYLADPNVYLNLSTAPNAWLNTRIFPGQVMNNVNPDSHGGVRDSMGRTAAQAAQDEHDATPGAWLWDHTGGVAIEAATSVLDWLLHIPEHIASFFLKLVEWFWIPLLARIAYFVFNLTIEMYVYLLWLAYPFWFYQKTSKAFTGALNTLIAVSFTAMTFCLLTMMFEGFAGAIYRSLTTGGGLAAISSIGAGVGAAAAASTAAAVATTGGALLVIGGAALAGAAAIFGIGYAIFYIVGTFLCFKIAPEIFKAFLEGSSVVTPMIGAAATAMISGAVGGLLGAAGAGAIGAKGAAVLASTNTASAIKSFASGAGKATTGILKGDKAQIKSGLKTIGKSAKVGGKALGRDLAAAPGAAYSAIKNKALSALKNPKDALLSLADNNFVKAGVVAAAGLSGSPTAPVKVLAELVFAQTTLEKLGGRGNPVPSGTRSFETTGGGATGGGGGSTPPTKPKIIVDEDEDFRRRKEGKKP